MVLGFSWLAEKVMNKRKEHGIRLIVVKVEIVRNGDNNSSVNRILDPINQGWL